MADKLTAKAKKDFMAKAKTKGWKKVRGREAISKSFVFWRFQCRLCMDEPGRHDG
jgi:hypothetical protein